MPMPKLIFLSDERVVGLSHENASMVMRLGVEGLGGGDQQHLANTNALSAMQKVS